MPPLVWRRVWSLLAPLVWCRVHSLLPPLVRDLLMVLLLLHSRIRSLLAPLV